MLFRKAFHDGIRARTTTVSYRIWKRPQVRPGGTYFIYPIGDIEVISIDEVDAVDQTDLTTAGFDSLSALEKALGQPGVGRQLYRIAFKYKGAAQTRGSA